MPGYAVLVRVEGVRPQRVPHGPVAPGTLSRQAPVDLGDGPAQLLTDLRGAGRTMSDHVDRFREIWAQTTFYLFDPESWR
jgi:hypothetical protein